MLLARRNEHERARPKTILIQDSRQVRMYLRDCVAIVVARNRQHLRVAQWVRHEGKQAVYSGFPCQFSRTLQIFRHYGMLDSGRSLSVSLQKPLVLLEGRLGRRVALRCSRQLQVTTHHAQKLGCRE